MTYKPCFHEPCCGNLCDGENDMNDEIKAKCRTCKDWSGWE